MKSINELDFLWPQALAEANYSFSCGSIAFAKKANLQVTEVNLVRFILAKSYAFQCLDNSISMVTQFQRVVVARLLRIYWT